MVVFCGVPKVWASDLVFQNPRQPRGVPIQLDGFAPRLRQRAPKKIAGASSYENVCWCAALMSGVTDRMMRWSVEQVLSTI